MIGKFKKLFKIKLDKNSPFKDIFELIKYLFALILIVVILYILQLLIQVIMFIQSNPMLILFVGLIIALIIAGYILQKTKSTKLASKERVINSYVMDEFLKEIVKAINDFNPVRKFDKEDYYQISLYSYLKAKFQYVRLEEQRGSSRPDITIRNIAIEIKGPTHSEDLKTIADKLIRYSQHFQHLIIVLFDLNVSRRYYQEWLNGIRKYFPDVIVIEK